MCTLLECAAAGESTPDPRGLPAAPAASKGGDIMTILAAIIALLLPFCLYLQFAPRAPIRR